MSRTRSAPMLANWEAATDGELTVHEFGEFICNSPDLVRCVVARGFDIMEPGHEGKILKRKFLRDITTHPEVCQIFGQYKPLKPLLRPQTFEKAFLALDCDHDGYATIDELTTFACGRAS